MVMTAKKNYMLKNRFDSIIFDLDGTLWDSTANVAKAWQAGIAEVDYVSEDMTQQKVRSITGMAYNVIFDTLFPYLDDRQRAELMGICARKELDMLNEHGGDLYPGLEEILDYLHGKYKLFIVSNCQNGYIQTFFNLSKLEHYFNGYQCYGTKGQPKSENIKDVVADYQLTAPVYIGDTLGDHDSALKAGVPFIFASYGFGAFEGHQIATISRLSDLKDLL